MVQIQIEKPRLGVPASLIVDDPAPCINPLYYFRLQVDRERYDYHEPSIPLSFLERFAQVARSHGIRGKFSVLPYPAGLGSIIDGWPGCDCEERTGWLELVRAQIAPSFDITPEILTHTLALDLRTRALLPQPEHEWMAGRTRAELAEYFGAALQLLRAAGFAPAGITQPCHFHGSREDYARATLDAIRAIGGPPVTFYFIDGQFDGPPVQPPEVVLLDRERGEAVVSILAYSDDHFWLTQRTLCRSAAQAADEYITPGGEGGRLVELASADAWLIFVTHWQSLYSDGSAEGLAALDEVGARLTGTYGARLTWLTLGEVARYRAASEGCRIEAQRRGDGWAITLDSAFGCPDFTISLDAGGAGESWDRVSLATSVGDQALRRGAGAGLLEPGTWRGAGGRLSLCFDLRRGRQIIHVQPEPHGS
jgi:hypothetical protein